MHKCKIDAHMCVYLYKIKNYIYKNVKRIGLAHALAKAVQCYAPF